MKQMVCEMCGGTDLIKQDGVFVCQTCGTKYSVEDAKKMIVEGNVEVTGTVKVDSTDELENLYKIARRAKEDYNSESGQKYYDMILVKDPNSWEAQFYSVYFRVSKCKIGEIESASITLANCLENVVRLIKDNVEGKNNQAKALTEVINKCASISVLLIQGVWSGYQPNGYYNNPKYFDAKATKVFIIASTLRTVIEMHFDENDPEFKQVLEDVREFDTTIKENSSKTTRVNEATGQSGCYIATAVYGSYNCPEVWTLRRFRDYNLAETWYGRAFIHIYYYISPTFVRWFGHTEWFKKMWRGKLDRMVKNLQDKGYESTPYEDKEW